MSGERRVFLCFHKEATRIDVKIKILILSKNVDFERQALRLSWLIGGSRRAMFSAMHAPMKTWNSTRI